MENRDNINFGGEKLSEDYGELVDINTMLDDEEFSIHRYMEISRRLTLRLEEGRYQELLDYLEGRGGQDFSESEKRLMIEIFDGFRHASLDFIAVVTGIIDLAEQLSVLVVDKGMHGRFKRHNLFNCYIIKIAFIGRIQRHGHLTDRQW